MGTEKKRRVVDGEGGASAGPVSEEKEEKGKGWAPGAALPCELFKGPIFSGCMVLIGTLVLIATIYTILVETCEVDPDEATHAASKSLSRPAPPHKVAPPNPKTNHKEVTTKQTQDVDRAVLSEILVEEVDQPTALFSPSKN